MRRLLRRWAPLAVVLAVSGVALGGSQGAGRAAGPHVDFSIPREGGHAGEDQLARLYAERRGEPLWITRQGPHSNRIAWRRSAVAQAESHGRRSAPYLAELDQWTREGGPRAELGLSALLVRYANDIRTPVPEALPHFVDPELGSAAFDLAPLFRASDDLSLQRALKDVQRLNPFYDRLRTVNAASAQPIILANMERTRALPPDMGDRFILVDVASAQLWMYEAGEAVDNMKVVVGQPGQPTPAMAGLIRFAVLQPYWNVPEDLAQTRFAAQVLRDGPAALERLQIEPLSDWSQQARIVDARNVDWPMVAAGRQDLRLRQRPGPHNMMGAAKFMFPNQLGIYLHDTPDKNIFARASRTLSSGCVRLEDAKRLWLWLYGAPWSVFSDGTPEQRVMTPDPVPVYILYLTARPDHDGIQQAPDIYRQDQELLVRLKAAFS